LDFIFLFLFPFDTKLGLIFFHILMHDSLLLLSPSEANDDVDSNRLPAKHVGLQSSPRMCHDADLLSQAGSY
jgi:hypothetical protein